MTAPASSTRPNVARDATLSAPSGRYERGTSRWNGAITAVLAATVVVVSFTTWSPLLDDAGSRLLGPLAVQAALVVATGIAMRALYAPVPLTLLVQLLVLVWTLTANWAPGSTGLAGIPTSDTVDRLNTVVERAVREAQTYQPPVPAEAAAFPLLALLLGAVALLLADLVSVALARPALTALPALVVITIPVVNLTEEGLPGWSTILTAVAYAALLSAQHAGELSAWASAGRRPRGLGAAAVISVAALTVAVVLTPVLPTRGEGVSPPGRGGGGDEVNLNNPIAELRRDLLEATGETVLSITTTGREPTYVRTTVLDVYSGERWEPGERSLPAGNAIAGRLPLPQGQVDTGRTQQWQLAAAGLDSLWLPLPFPARSADAGSGFFYDDSTLDAYNVENRSVAGTKWMAEALLPGWRAASLREASTPSDQTVERWTALPDDFPEPVSQLARAITRGEATQYDQAVALQRWFVEDGGFTYSLQNVPAGNDEGSLVAFLDRDGRVGYCEQFSASMAVMARSLGIPARVSVGFLSGEAMPTIDGQGVRYDFTGRDLHAWPELYFSGSGWVRFEPTPSIRTGEPPPWTTGAREEAPAPDATPTPTRTPSASAEPQAPQATPTPTPATADDRPADEVGTAPAEAFVTWIQDHVRGLLALGLLVLVVASLGIPALVRERRRTARRRAAGQGDVEAAWKELLDHARDLGIATDPDATVRRNAQLLHLRMGVPYADRVLVGGPQQAASPATVSGAVHHLAHRLEERRYAPSSDETPVQGDAAAGAGFGLPSAREDSALTALDTAARELTERATPAQQRRARWWPPSVLG